MRCEACGYQFLLASSTKCPDCGDLREAIVKESDIQAAMGHANALTNHSVIGKRPFEQVADILVTPEMLAAGVEFERTSLLRSDIEPYSGIYRAMAAVAPQDETPPERRSGHSKLVYDKALRTIVTVSDEPSSIPIMDSVVGLKAANAHMARRVAELEGDKSRRDILAQNIPPATGLPPLDAEAWREIAMAYQFEIDDLTRQLAAQALAHAEQMENVGAKAAKMLLAKNFRIAKLEAQLAMRVTSVTQPTDVQQTASDVKVAAQPKTFPAGALKTGGSDPRRMGP